jgi:hypothetical protein
VAPKAPLRPKLLDLVVGCLGALDLETLTGLVNSFLVVFTLLILLIIF